MTIQVSYELQFRRKYVGNDPMQYTPWHTVLASDDVNEIYNEEEAYLKSGTPRENLQILLVTKDVWNPKVRG